ncbi:MAG: type 1 glutamine amidotransferase [Oculatellaceae cyanobacterium Prado106]|jgi:protease I|nr:type 1 glutamine amidotransferase [Oculatellaceae cyanobacterium Prado106]
MTDLSQVRVAVLATDGFEEAELTEPVKALQQAGAKVEIIAPQTEKPGQIQAFQHHDKSITVKVDRPLDQAQPSDYDAVLLPGGALNADMLRVEPKVQSFLQQMQQTGKPLAAICHAPWALVSANLVRGRTLTSYYTVQDDIRNAGGNWVDREVMVDGN